MLIFIFSDNQIAPDFSYFFNVILFYNLRILIKKT